MFPDGCGCLTSAAHSLKQIAPLSVKHHWRKSFLLTAFVFWLAAATPLARTKNLTGDAGVCQRAPLASGVAARPRGRREVVPTHSRLNPNRFAVPKTRLTLSEAATPNFSCLSASVPTRDPHSQAKRCEAAAPQRVAEGRHARGQRVIDIHNRPPNFVL